MSKAKPKRNPAFNDSQMAFSFEPRPRASSEGALAGIERQVASAVAQILKEDPRSRFEVAGGVSALLDDEVSKAMLDAYASEARDGHNVSFGRFLALIADTGRYDILRGLLWKIGVDLVEGEEVYTVKLGHLEAQKKALDEEIRHVRRIATPICRRGGPRA